MRDKHTTFSPVASVFLAFRGPLLWMRIAVVACGIIPMAMAQNAPIASSAAANGLVIYKEQGFHSDQQARQAVYVSAKVIPQMVTVILTNGAELSIPAGKSPVLIPFPNDTDNPDKIVAQIDTSIARFPQYKSQLETVKAHWLTRKASGIQKKQKVEALPIPDLPAETESVPQNEDTETRFRGGIVTHIYPDGITVSSDEGVRKIRFSSLSEEEKARFGYDPKKEAEFIQQKKQANDDRLREEQKNLTAQQNVRSDVKPPNADTDQQTLAENNKAEALSPSSNDAPPLPAGWKIGSSTFVPKLLTRNGKTFNSVWIQKSQPGWVDVHLKNNQSKSLWEGEILGLIFSNSSMRVGPWR